MTLPDLDALAAVVGKMTPGPWEEVYGRVDGRAIADDDAAGIVSLRNAWPEVEAELRELRRAADERAARAQEGSQNWRDLCAMFDWKGDTPAELAGMAVAELRELRAYRGRRCETCRDYDSTFGCDKPRRMIKLQDNATFDFVPDADWCCDDWNERQRKAGA
jgi:hypothetical protein